MSIECCLVLGEVEGGEGHAWNLVKLDGEYYYMDPTWGDASYRMEDEVEITSPYPLPEINYDYLNVTTQQLLKTHTLDHIVPLPECTSNVNNYYVREGCMFTEYDETMLAALFEKNLSRGKTDVTIKCATDTVYRQLKDQLIEQQQIFNFLGTEYNSVAYAENDKQLSLTFWMTNG